MHCGEKDRSKGKVWLVGAGPSDAGLVTVRAREVLEQADVIVYDRLAGQGALTYANPCAEYIDVGKKAGNHPVPQGEINRILAEKALEGKTVVRLKGGDPYVFGRGAEEALLLRQSGVPFEVIPGVTSAVAVPACQGIPVTYREMASSFHVMTAHKKDGTFPDIPYEALTKAGGTLVFLMGVHTLHDVRRGLLDSGMKASVPVAILERGTTAGQRKIVATLETIEEVAKKEAVRTPAIIVVGEVAGICGLEWYGDKPLAGKKIMVTRPRGRSAGISAMLRDRGAEVLELPVISLQPAKAQIPWEDIAAGRDAFEWLVFTSPSGVEIFLEGCRERRLDLRALAGVRLAVIGPGTAGELEKAGLYPDLMPEIYDSIHLGEALGQAAESGERILLLRAREGSRHLTEELAKAGHVQVRDIPLYDTVLETIPWVDCRKEWEDHLTDYVIFTSASTVRGFVHNGGTMDYSCVRALCIGPQTAQKAKEYGMQVFTAREATMEALTELAEEVE